MWNGLLGFSGQFRTVFDNTEYSTVPLPKPDEVTYFFSDLTLYADFHLIPGVIVSLGGKASYPFGSDAPGAGGPQTYLRIRGTYDGKHQHWTFGHFRDTITPLTFYMRDYDDDLAGMRCRLVFGPSDSRLFLARMLTVGTGRYEIFAYGGRSSLTPWKVTTLGVNLGGTHQGGFDAGIGSPPTAGRKREVTIGSLDLRQDIVGGIYAAGESAISISRSDLVDGAARDNAFWAGLGWKRGPVDFVGRFTGWGGRSRRRGGSAGSATTRGPSSCTIFTGGRRPAHAP